MEVIRRAELQAVAGPPEWFTGRVTITGQFQRPSPPRVDGALVRLHIAIQEAQDGSPVTWMEHVSDAEYLAGPTRP